MKKLLLATCAFSILIAPSVMAFDLMGTLKKTVEESTSSVTGGSSTSSLTTDQIISGLREALKVGTQNVVNKVGVQNGYNADPAIHIPLPEQLQQVQSLMKKFGLSQMADDVELRLNRAAEQAAPQAKDIIWSAIQNMSLDDAKKIYDGPKDAATQYFRKISDTQLREMISPIAEENLKDVGAIQAYDALMGKYKTMPFVPDVSADLVDHTTNLAINGIFHYLAQEEAAIRENPAKRTTEILKTVFGQ